MKAHTKKLHPILKVIISILLAVLIIAAAYFLYVVIAYHRVPDMQALEVTEHTKLVAETGKTYTAMTYNIGFGAYTSDYGFFMDGGTQSWANSKESVIENTNRMVDLIQVYDPDFIMLEEVDVDGTRSYHVDEKTMIFSRMLRYDCTGAVSYDSPFLMYPFNEPHGKNKSVLAVLSRFNISSALRRQLPIEESLMKFLDCDRCYSVNRIPVENGKELIVYASHLSAYTSDGTVSDKQLELLVEDMQSEYDKGNYVILGADFNKDLLIDSSKYFGKPDIVYTWAQPLKLDLSGTGLNLQAPINPIHPVPTCRNADGPYHKGQFVVTIDGFITSDNIEVISNQVIDSGFAYSDHNPVVIEFKLKD